MKQYDIDNWFTYHAPNAVSLVHYNDIRSKAKELAELFDKTVPDCADKTAAIRHLRETVMAMNLAIACYREPDKSESFGPQTDEQILFDIKHGTSFGMK